MSEVKEKRSAMFWFLVASGVAVLVAAATIIAAFLVPTVGRVPISFTKHIEAPALVPVTGTVTLDGKPVKSAIVKFVPNVDFSRGPMLVLPSIGFTDADGKYRLTHAADGDGKAVIGAVVGPHQIRIELHDSSGGQIIPARYSTSQSDLKADVKKGMPPLDFALKSEPVEKPE